MGSAGIPSSSKPETSKGKVAAKEFSIIPASYNRRVQPKARV